LNPGPLATNISTLPFDLSENNNKCAVSLVVLYIYIPKDSLTPLLLTLTMVAPLRSKASRSMRSHSPSSAIWSGNQQRLPKPTENLILFHYLLKDRLNINYDASKLEQLSAFLSTRATRRLRICSCVEVRPRINNSSSLYFCADALSCGDALPAVFPICPTCFSWLLSGLSRAQVHYKKKRI